MFKYARPWLRLVSNDVGTPGEGGSKPEQSTGDPDAPSNEGPVAEKEPETDWQEKYEAQRKINRDLEKKMKGEAGTLSKTIEELQAKIDGREAEYKAQLEQEEQREAARKEALAAADSRILKAELRAAAAGKLSDPSDAMRYIDVSQFDVGEDGEIDSGALASAISELLEERPYLAAKGGGNVMFESPGGRREGDQLGQLAQGDLKDMSPAEINAAFRAGRLKNLLEGK